MEWETIEEINLKVAKKVARIRKRKKISQEKLAISSNVSLGSIKRFERTGEISLYSLTKICRTLGIEMAIKNLFDAELSMYNTIEEVKNDRKI